LENINKQDNLMIYNLDIPEDEIILNKENKVKKLRYFNTIITNLQNNSINYNFIIKTEEHNNTIEQKINSFGDIIIKRRRK